MHDLSTTLSSLRDLEGIVGSFVVNEAGEVVAKDLPAYFDGVLEEVGPRVLRLREALDLAQGDVTAYSVRYAGYKLTIRSIGGALIAVIADAKINGPALRMAMNLVIRKCGIDDLAGPQSRPSRTPPPPTPARLAFPVTSREPATTTPISADSTRSESLASAQPPLYTKGGAPEGGGPSQPRRKRELLFRGKRVG